MWVSQSHRAILQILSLPSVGVARAAVLLEACATQRESLETLTPDIIYAMAMRLWPKQVKEESFLSWQKHLLVLEQALAISQENGVQQVNLFEKHYPPLLRFLKNPPLILHYQGNIEHLQHGPLLTWIGTRKPNPLSQRLGKRIAQQWVDSDIHLVSGLAEGSDAIGHQAAVDAGKATTAILGHGLQQIYPSQHRRLAEQILENGGALITESLWGVQPHRGLFVRRDLLQAGISDATFVLETTLDGGSIHAMKGALSLKRPLLALQYSPKIIETYCHASTLEKLTGNHHYITSGLASAIESRVDIQYWITHLQTLSQQRDMPREMSDVKFQAPVAQSSFDW